MPVADVCIQTSDTPGVLEVSEHNAKHLEPKRLAASFFVGLLAFFFLTKCGIKRLWL